jgi:small subunit ribosomal protein S1
MMEMQICERFLPEGMNAAFQKNAAEIRGMDGLIRAAAEKAVLEAVAVRCGADHALHVPLGGFDAVLPRAEAMHPDIAGADREISVLSRVGKYICFRVTSAGYENGTARVLLSRRSVQGDALDLFFSSARVGDVVPAAVTHLAPFGAFADVGCGITALLPLENISVCRISHPSDRFSQGERIFAAVSKIDAERRRLWLTHRELLGTWEENAGAFTAGETVRGTVRSVEDYGVFVELTPNLCGLADSFRGVAAGDGVSVFIKSITPGRMKIKLRIIEKLQDARPLPLQYFITRGRLGRWDYSPESCPKKLTSDFTSSP